MSPVLALARKDLRRFLGDRRALIVNFSLPLLLTTIMGLSFGGGLFGQDRGISAIPVALVGRDLPEMLKDQLAEGLRESGFFAVAWTDSLTADTQVRKGEVVAAVVLPEELLGDFFSLKPVTIQLWKDPASGLKAGIVQQILERSLRQYQAGEAAYFGLWPEGRTSRWGMEAAQEAESFFAGDLREMWRTWREEPQNPVLKDVRDEIMTAIDRNVALQDAFSRPVVAMKVHDKARSASAASASSFSAAESPSEANLFNYFLPSFSVFFLMFAVAASARDLHREGVSGTLRRQMLGPVGRGDLLVGKWVSSTLQGILMLGVLYLVGGFAFRVNLGADPLSLPLMVVLCCGAASSFFLLLAQVTSTEKLMDNLSTIVVLVSALIGGNMLPIDAMPSFFHFVGRIGFNYWANVGFSDIMVRNQGLFDDPEPTLVLLAMTLGFGALNWLLARIRPYGGVWS